MAIQKIDDLRGSKKVIHKEIFVVHGHDVALRESVARYLERLELIPIVLHEQKHQGHTIIEKFETNAKRATFAIVLLTADDLGKSKGGADDKLQPRARQNVVFELGFFIAKLSRSKVCILYENGVDLPSDLHGMIYVPYDDRGSWKLELARHMKDAGIPCDLNKVPNG